MAKKARARGVKVSDHDRTRALRADFAAAHKAGQKALKDRNFERLGRVIERERELIDQQRKRLDQRRTKTQK